VSTDGGDATGARGRRIAVAIGLAVAVLWELSVQAGIMSGRFLPPPTETLAALYRGIQSGEMVASVAITVRRVFSGLLLGASLGLVAGWVLGASRRLSAVTDPMIAALHPIPKLALLPLFMMLLGLGETARVAVIAAAAFFPMVVNSMAGVRHINPLHFDVARSYGANRWDLLGLVILPGSAPMVLTGLRLSANVAFLSTTAVEMVAANDGLGALIWLSWQVLRPELLFATLFVIAVLGVTLNVALRWVARRAAPWLGERATAV
jgi:NitT/TauT family transport system permease protein